jgi:superfamily II DNA or RNA helicase
VVELPTGHGKTHIIAALALIIAEDLNQIVIVVSMNAYLS